MNFLQLLSKNKPQESNENQPLLGASRPSAVSIFGANGFTASVIYAVIGIFSVEGLAVLKKHPFQLFTPDNFILAGCIIASITSLSLILGVWADAWDKKHPQLYNANPARKIFNVIPGLLFLITHLKDVPMHIAGLKQHDKNDCGSSLFKDRTGIYQYGAIKSSSNPTYRQDVPEVSVAELGIDATHPEIKENPYSLPRR